MHLVDGIPFGRPPQRRPIRRPMVNIPPRIRETSESGSDTDDAEENLPALEGRRRRETHNSILIEEIGWQRLLDADFGGDDSHDEDFEPVDDSDDDDDEDEEQVVEPDGDQHAEEDENNEQMGEKTQQGAENRSRPNKRSSSRRALSREFHSAVPTSNHYRLQMTT